MEDTWENLPQSLKSHHNVRIILSHEKPLVLIDCGGGGLATKSCPTVENPINCSLPGFSVHGISQARTLEWVAISFSRGSSPSRDQIQVSCNQCGNLCCWLILRNYHSHHNLQEQPPWSISTHQYRGNILHQQKYYNSGKVQMMVSIF